MILANRNNSDSAGRELGRFGLEEFLEYKSLQFKPQA